MGTSLKQPTPYYPLKPWGFYKQKMTIQPPQTSPYFFFLFSEKQRDNPPESVSESEQLIDYLRVWWWWRRRKDKNNPRKKTRNYYYKPCQNAVVTPNLFARRFFLAIIPFLPSKHHKLDILSKFRHPTALMAIFHSTTLLAAIRASSSLTTCTVAAI